MNSPYETLSRVDIWTSLPIPEIIIVIWFLSLCNHRPTYTTNTLCLVNVWNLTNAKRRVLAEQLLLGRELFSLVQVIISVSPFYQLRYLLA